MFGRKKTDDKDINKKKLNELISLSRNTVKILYVLLIVIGVYALIKLAKEIQFFEFILVILKILAPLFIGFIIAWLFDPLVKWLQKKGLRRSIGTAVTYIILFGLFVLIIGGLIPLLSDQLNEFIKVIPNIVDNARQWIEQLLDRLSVIDGLDVESLKDDILTRIIDIGTNITSDLPSMLVGFVKNLISGMGSIIIGLVIGFYLLMSFDNVNDTLITLFPKRIQRNTNELVYEINTSLRKFVVGACIDAFLIFVVSSIGFCFVGLKAPFLFALFCALTNIIPYAGPYIGGIPAVVVAFSQSPTTGIFTLLIIVIVQFLEGNFIQPIVMSKTTKLHPVTIMLGLLIFGHFFGIVGMFISTPVIAALKAIFTYFDDKYDLIKSKEDV
ncbi:MAG: AI-2E family transporter [Bacilli bacterium]|nr:AI-2E family transporter [Bacilli bacterium]